MSDPPLTDSEPVTVANGEQADAVPATETGKADDPSIVAPTDAPDGTTDLATGSDEMSETFSGTVTSTADATETAALDESSTDPTAADAPESSAGVPASEPAKPAPRTRTPRPMERGSVGLGQLRDPLRHRDAGRPTTRTAASDDEKGSAGPCVGRSSRAESSSPGTKSPGGNSQGGDADDS